MAHGSLVSVALCIGYRQLILADALRASELKSLQRNLLFEFAQATRSASDRSPSAQVLCR